MVVRSHRVSSESAAAISEPFARPASHGQPADRRAGTRRSALHLNVLVLNRNFAAVHVISVQRAMCLLWKNQAEVISVEAGHYATYDFTQWLEQSELKAELAAEETDDRSDWLKAVNFEVEVPRIIRLLRYDRLPRNTVKFNRRNVFLRDEHCCQYCGNRFASTQLSLDHVVPRSRGGGESWENIVCACLDCNVRKGGRTPREAGMELLKEPVKPKSSPLMTRQLDDHRYASWRPFLHSHMRESKVESRPA